MYLYLYIYIYTVNPRYSKNLCLKQFFTHLVGFQPTIQPQKPLYNKILYNKYHFIRTLFVVFFLEIFLSIKKCDVINYI